MARGMKKSVYFDRLAKVPLFRTLSKRDLQRLGRHADLVNVEAGRELTKEGQSGREMFVIATGKAVVRRKNRKVADLKRGDFFGELALLGNAPRNATVVAESDMELYVLSRPDFSSVLREVPEISVKLLEALAQRVSESDAKTI